jgi:hypothetical protein
MIKKQLLALALTATVLIGTQSASLASAGIYDPFVIVNSTTSGGNAFYDLGATTINPDFQGASLGTFDPVTDFLRLGGQQKSFKNNGTDVTGHFLQYRVYLTGSPTGSYTSVSYPFQWNQGDSGAPGGLGNPGDQQWGTDVQGSNGTNVLSSNLLTGLANGNYTLEAYSEITTNGVDASSSIANNNGGSNYTATFTVIPEPSTVSLLLGSSIFGGLFLLRRRRA